MEGANLVLHCGGRQVSREELDLIDAPERTKSWNPITHGRLLNEIIEGLGRQDIEVTDMRLAVGGREDARFFGILGVSMLIMDGIRLLLGIRNSVDKSMSAGVALGERCFVCDNEAFSGTVTLFRKHTPNIEKDMPTLVDQCVERLPQFSEIRQGQIEHMGRIGFDDTRMRDLVVRGVEKGALRKKDAWKALDVWYADDEDPTVWRAYNACTQVLRPDFDLTGPRAARQAHRTLKLNNMINRMLLEDKGVIGVVG